MKIQTAWSASGPAMTGILKVEAGDAGLARCPSLVYFANFYQFDACAGALAAALV